MLMSCDERFIAIAQELGYDIYGENTAGGHYSPVIRLHDQVYVSGLVPMMSGRVILPGRVGANLSLTEGQKAARISAMRGLALILQTIGSLDRIKTLVRVTVYVKSTEDFPELSEVANGASDVLHRVLGDAGRHTRTTIGVYQLPKNAAIEVDIIAAVSEGALRQL
ncbi:RidA family protein [Pseudomonas gingeri]|uniref:RidA family protein n=2 Tax=Pseudomonas gingeri TaxID=117681 RepID=A0A7Y7YIB6_9PSED|nr:RidA family protein [Pseudomonas gingeri]NWA01360.1 RidA family protein [Pseudomonas gingeri]NWA13837.1 RidA family protein [Pseudomonas gingeri]NWA52803.1 RidA family protein [Pseudomonas gingeri]NWA96300.1 RidA family protein [Pseudomonas gingeri]NWB00064.1 RidA family protein [Pseudomonas gingeri]